MNLFSHIVSDTRVCFRPPMMKPPIVDRGDAHLHIATFFAGGDNIVQL